MQNHEEQLMQDSANFAQGLVQGGLEFLRETERISATISAKKAAKATDSRPTWKQELEAAKKTIADKKLNAPSTPKLNAPSTPKLGANMNISR